MGRLISSLSFFRANLFASTLMSMVTSWEPILRLVSFWFINKSCWSGGEEVTLMEKQRLPDSGGFPLWACYDTSSVASEEYQERLVENPAQLGFSLLAG